MKKILVLMLTLALIVMAAGCAGTTNETTAATTTAAAAVTTAAEATGKENKDITIGYICKHQLDDFMQTLRKGAEEHAAKIGVNLIFMSTERHTEVEKQVQLMDDMITKQVDAIILVATDPTALIPAIKRANEANIPVVLVNDTIDDAAAKEQGAEYVTYIGTDNFQGGKVGGEFIAAKYPDGAKVAVLSGTPGLPAGDARITGFQEGVKANSKIEIVSIQPTDWSRDQGFSVMQNVLTANPDITAVYCAADLIALGAMEAIEQAGLGDKIKVLGFDGSVEAIEMAKAGRMLGSVAQFPYEMSVQGIDTALKVLAGETNIPKVINTDCKVLPES